METNSAYRVELFLEKINKDGPLIKPELGKCWQWTAAKDTDGYGNFTVAKGKTGKAHKFSFKLAYGWLLEKPYQLDHKCENTSCVRPSHLTYLHGKKNNEKSNSASAINGRKTHCIRNHEFSDENTIKKYGRRYCITCEKERGRM